LIGVQRVDFVVVPTRDRDRAVKFYGETLGLSRNPLSSPNFPEFEAGNVTVALVVPDEVGIPFSNLPPGQIAFRVPDVAAARAELEAAGVEFGADTLDTGVCHMAWFTDPDGNGLMIHHRYAPYSDGSQP